MSAEERAIFDRELVRRRRTRHARQAAETTFLLDHAADDIADRLALVKRPFEVALDLGAGPGRLSARLAAMGVGLVISADLSAEMMAPAGGLRVVCDEELLPIRPGSMDLVVSGLALQQVNDLPGALIQIRRALKPDGLMVVSLLGGRTLFELREALVVAETETTGGASPRLAPFADVRELGQLLQRTGFALPVADSDVVEVGYRSALELMRDLRGMGWANPLRERRAHAMRRDTLQRAVEVYAERFARADGRVTATFEIVTLTGWAPHDSQQKPLRPGSATARLADALGTTETQLPEKPERG
jgi:SAM-dependent methyltransferase